MIETKLDLEERGRKIIIKANSYQLLYARQLLQHFTHSFILHNHPRKHREF
jgi:hypothetical protein